MMTDFLRKPFLVPLLVLILASLSVVKGHEWGDDFALYLSQSEAMAAGELDVLQDRNGLMMDRSDGQLGPNLYPHGYPALLMLAGRLPGGALLWGKALNVALLVLAAVLFMQTFATSGRMTAMAALFSFGHPKVLEGVNRVQADVFFLALFMAFVWVLKTHQSGYKRLVLLGLLAWLATEVRPNGLFLLPAVAVFVFEQQAGSMINRLKKGFLAVLLPMLVFGLAFITLRSALPEGSGNLWAVLKGVSGGMMLDNASYYGEMVGIYPLWHGINVLKSLWPIFGVLFALVTWLLIIRGWQVFSGWSLTVLYLVGSSLAMFVIWPSQQGFRYLYPLMPFLMLAFFQGIMVLLGEKRSSWLFAAIAAALLAQSAATVYFLRFKLPDQAYQPDMRKVYDWVKSNSSPADTVVFFKPRLMYHETRRISFRKDSLTASSVPQRAWVVLTDTSARNLKNYFRAGSQQQVLSAGKVAVYRWEIQGR